MSDDYIDGEKINLNENFEKTIKDSLHHDMIKIKEEQFMLYHICMHEGADKHELHLCANNREVRSDEVQFEEMNLWIIDDRLAYHHFLASDKQMKSLPVLESDISKRMDIAIFDQAISFSVDKNDINSISIIELKKPQRNDLAPDDKNPIKPSS